MTHEGHDVLIRKVSASQGVGSLRGEDREERVMLVGRETLPPIPSAPILVGGPRTLASGEASGIPIWGSGQCIPEGHRVASPNMYLVCLCCPHTHH